MTDGSRTIAVGVIGVGSMGENHARVYRELEDAELVGVVDAEDARANEVAVRYGAEPMDVGQLLEAADAVSVAVPTEYHYDTVRECIDAGVDVLVEKPLVEDLEKGRRLVDFADRNDCTLQVGHVERFNPTVQSLLEMASDLDLIAVTADRLSPPVDRGIEDSAVMDLMIHDLDVFLALVDGEPTNLEGVSTAEGGYAAATVEFDSGVVGQATASRVTQESVRELTISARECRVTVDYADQSIEISRKSVPEYVLDDGNVEYHHERVVEEVRVDDGEPLKHQLSSFVDASRGNHDAVVDGEDGLRAVELARRIEQSTADGRESTRAIPR